MQLGVNYIVLKFSLPYYIGEKHYRALQVTRFNNSNSSLNDFILIIYTNSQNDYETITKEGNAGLFVNQL